MRPPNSEPKPAVPAAYDACKRTPVRNRYKRMASLWWGFLFSTIGLGYFIYGKRQHAPVPLVCGLGLMLFPYLISGSWALVLIGAALMGLPYFVRF